MTAETYSIGRLAELTGLPVKTIRFYSDSGLLPPSGRTEAGHRRYTDDDLTRLQLVRSLRDLDVDLPTISRVLEGRGRLGDVLRTHIAALETRVRSLQRQLVVLRAAGDSPTRATVRRVQALATLDKVERRRMLESFWDRAIGGAPLDPAIEARFRAAGTPELPDDPTPEQLDAWIELAGLVEDEGFQATTRHAASWVQEAAGHAADQAALANASMEFGRAAMEASAEGIAPDDPRSTAMVDRWAGAWAAGLGREDGLEFRAWLLEQMDRASDPRAARYWELIGIVSGATPGRGQAAGARTLNWLLEALRADVARAGPR
jgi:DNA-binding transcriptional MerR regulator